MKIVSNFTFILIFLCSSFLVVSQENKVHDSLLRIYQTMPKDSNRVAKLYAVYESVLFNDIKLAKKYADQFLKEAKAHGSNRQVGSAYYAKCMVQRTIGNKDSHNIYVAKAKKIFQKENYLRGIIDTDKAMAIIYDEDGRDDLAIQLLLQNIEKEKILKDTVLLANDYKHLAGIYADRTNYTLALEYCTLALKLHEKTEDSLRFADALYQMGIIEIGLGNSKNAEENYAKALEIYIKENDKFYQALTYENLGSIYFDLGNNDKAEAYLKKALTLAKEMKSTLIEGNVLATLGINMIKLKEYDKGIKNLQSALALAENNDRQNSVAGILYKIAEAQFLKTSYSMALQNIEKGIDISKSGKNLKFVGDFLSLRSKIYESQERTILALKDYKGYTKIKDSLFTIEKSKQIEELRAVYDTEKKEQQIAKQETEISLLEEREKVSNLQKILLGGGLGLSLVALSFGFYGFRQRSKRARIEKEKVEAELAFKKKELTTHALHLAKKNEVLEQVKQKAKELKSVENIEKGYQTLVQTINFDQQDDRAWENFTQYFEAVHKDFAKEAVTKYPDISKNELRLMALIKMNLSSKEIASILNISSDGVKKARQRLRKKMNLLPTDSLETTVMAI